LSSNLKVLDKPKKRDVKLPNGQVMQIEGYCEFEIELGGIAVLAGYPPY